jgi:hypothetical protein
MYNKIKLLAMVSSGTTQLQYLQNIEDLRMHLLLEAICTMDRAEYAYHGKCFAVLISISYLDFRKLLTVVIINKCQSMF